MNRPLDRKRTLDELDPPAWGAPDYGSHLVTTCHRLRGVPIGALGTEDLRILIGQGIGLPWLVPLALEMLETDPMAQGDFYPGDLLASVLRVPGGFWSREWEWRNRLNVIVGSLESVPDELTEKVAAFRRRTA